MKKYHFSAKIKGCTLSYHGEFSTSFVEVDEIVKKAKVTLLEKLKNWNLKPEDITAFEVYRFEGEKEIHIFGYST